jgi:hypothetical protein
MYQYMAGKLLVVYRPAWISGFITVGFRIPLIVLSGSPLLGLLDHGKLYQSVRMQHPMP